MKSDNSDIQAAIEKTQAIIRDDKQMSAGARSIVEVLLLIIKILLFWEQTGHGGFSTEQRNQQ